MPSYNARFEGLKFPTIELAKLKLDKKDYILYSNGSRFLKKYVNNANFVNFDVLEILILDKSKTEALKVFNKQFVLSTNKHNALEQFTPFLLNPKPTKELRQFINSSIEQIPKGGRYILVESLDYGHNINFQLINDDIKQCKENKIRKKDYQSILLEFIRAKIDIDIKNILDNSHLLKKIDVINLPQQGAHAEWRYTIYQKV